MLQFTVDEIQKIVDVDKESVLFRSVPARLSSAHLGSPSCFPNFSNIKTSDVSEQGLRLPREPFLFGGKQ
jgi:hypothetical protein